MYTPTMRAIGCGLTITIVAAASAMIVMHQRPLVVAPSAVQHVILCRTLLSSGDLDAATDVAREAVSIEPTSADAQLCLADVFAAKSDWRHALESYREAARLERDNVWAHRGIADALSALDDTLGAERELRECVRIAPDDAESHMNLASNLAVQKRFAEAIEEMKRADELGSELTEWKYPTKEWIAEFERELVEHGDAPKTPVER